MGNSGDPHIRPSPPEYRRRGRGLQRYLLVATLAGALLVASACEVDVGVDIDVAENGSGTVSVGVSLDRAAADALGDLANQIDLEDLALAGWEASGPAREADNLLWLRATKPFGSAEELPSILAEIAGPDVFRGFELRRRAEFAEQTWEVAGRVDPAAAFPELLDTLAFNRGLEEQIRIAVGESGGGSLTSGVNMRLSIDLPGELRSGGDVYTWTAIDEDSTTSSVAVRLTATEVNTTARTLRLVGLAAAALFVLALLLNLLGWWYIRRHRKRSERALLARADSEQLPAVATGAGAAVATAAAAVGDAADYGDLWDAADYGEPWSTADAGGGRPGGEFALPEETGAVTGIDDDIDWEELTEAEYEDLSADVADNGDLAVPHADASADDWTALLEGTQPDDAGAGADAGVSEPLDADRQEPEATEQPEPVADQPAPVAERLFDPAETVDVPVEPLDVAIDPESAEHAPEPQPEPEPAEPQPEPEFESAEPQPEPEFESAEPEPEPEPSPTGDATESAAVAQPDADVAAEPLAATTASADAPHFEPETAAEADETGEPPAVDDMPDEALGVAEAEPAAAPIASGRPSPSRALRLVVIGGWGVLFQPAEPAGELLIPFVRQSGSTASPAEIREAYRLATLGRLTPGQLWEACGLAGEPTWTHGPYTGRMTVSTGAADFVRSLLRRGVGVACITNDVSEWSWRLRVWTGFEAVTPWVISSDIGIRKPDPGVFEMLRRVSGIPFANCLVIDSDRRTLDAARSLGMSTALFGTRSPGQPVADTAHPAVGDFTDLIRRT